MLHDCLLLAFYCLLLVCREREMCSGEMLSKNFGPPVNRLLSVHACFRGRGMVQIRRMVHSSLPSQSCIIVHELHDA